MPKKHTRKIDRMHKLFDLEPGHTCGECVNFICGQYRSKILRKCMVYGLTHSEASDWAKSWPACKMFGHEYRGRPVIELRETQNEPEMPLEGQLDLLGGDMR